MEVAGILSLLYSCNMKKKTIAHNYTALFEHDTDSGWFVATVPVLPGCISQGKTFEQAVKNITEAAELYLESLTQKERRGLEKSTMIIAPILVTAQYAEASYFETQTNRESVAWIRIFF